MGFDLGALLRGGGAGMAGYTEGQNERKKREEEARRAALSEALMNAQFKNYESLDRDRIADNARQQDAAGRQARLDEAAATEAERQRLRDVAADALAERREGRLERQGGRRSTDDLNADPDIAFRRSVVEHFGGSLEGVSDADIAETTRQLRSDNQYTNTGSRVLRTPSTTATVPTGVVQSGQKQIMKQILIQQAQAQGATQEELDADLAVLDRMTPEEIRAETQRLVQAGR